MDCYNLQIGSAVCGFRVRDRRLYEWFVEYFMAPSSERGPDACIDIRLMEPSPVEAVPDSFFQSKRMKGRRFWMEGGLIRGRFGFGSSRITMLLHPVMVESDASRVFEQSLYQVYFSMLGNSALTAPLIHSSGVIRDGKGFLFLGPSEAGKSTVASLSSQYSVINDEITIADFTGAVPMLVSTPFNGLFRTKAVGSAPLAGIFVLEKSPDDRIEPLSQSAAIRPVADQIIPLVPLGKPMTAEAYFTQLDVAAALHSRVPVYKLMFTKSPRFWGTISGIL